MKLGCAFPLLLCLCLPAAAERRAEELLRRVGELYRNAESYHFAARERTAIRGKDGQKTTGLTVVTARGSEGRSRVELDNRAASGAAVDDGVHLWVYLPAAAQYVKLPSGAPPPAAAGLDFAAAAKRFTDRYAIVGERILEAKIAGSEPQSVNGETVDCLVVDAEYGPPPGLRGGKIARRFWIERRSLAVVREHATAVMKTPRAGGSVETIQDIRFDVARAGKPVSPDVFRFTPPRGARPVESFGETGGLATGGPAPDFTLPGFDGESVRLSSLRGKVVLLDFWATWCAPCRYDMPFVQQLYEELKPRGLEVFGVNAESGGEAADYLRRLGCTFPNLRDRSLAVSRLYRIRSIPTFVVIDRQGNLAGHMQGTRSKEQLRRAVLEAGL